MKNIEFYVESFKTKYEAFLIGCDSIEEMELWDKEALGEMDAFYTNDMVGVIIRLIASDGDITLKETRYLNETFGFDYTVEELRNAYEGSRECLDESFDESFENGISYMRRINSKLADAYKELLVLICDIITHSDGSIDFAELEEVERLKKLCE